MTKRVIVLSTEAINLLEARMADFPMNVMPIIESLAEFVGDVNNDSRTATVIKSRRSRPGIVTVSEFGTALANDTFTDKIRPEEN